MTEKKRFRSADEIYINIWDFIDKTFMGCQYYCKPFFKYGFFTLGLCNNPKRCHHNGELVQCIGSDCEDIVVVMR